MKRVDALGDQHPERLHALTGEVLDDRLDDVLQAVVHEAAHAIGMPIALVSLVLDRTQFFRAQVGLPLDLAVARATDRDASFCQFVVRDGQRFEVTHASEDGRVPQDLVDRYGIESYLGEPVTVGASVVGSLCVIGTDPRSFSDADRANLARLATRVGERLTQLSQRTRATSRALLSRAAAPAFAEARNILAVFELTLATARVAAADAAPLARTVRELAKSSPDQVPALGTLTGASNALDTLRKCLGDLDDACKRLMPTLGAMHGLLGRGEKGVLVAEVVDVATRLAHHQTKLVGGVSWMPSASHLRLRTPRMVAVAVVASALGVIADALPSTRSGIRGAVNAVDNQIVIELWSEETTADRLDRCLAQLSELIDGEAHVIVAVAADRLTMRFPDGGED